MGWSRWDGAAGCGELLPPVAFAQGWEVFQDVGLSVPKWRESDRWGQAGHPNDNLPECPQSAKSSRGGSERAGSCEDVRGRLSPSRTLTPWGGLPIARPEETAMRSRGAGNTDCVSREPWAGREGAAVGRAVAAAVGL